MKNVLPLFVLICLALASCKKDNNNINESIVGDWNIISDSTWSSGIGPYGTPSSYVYKGVTGDHFDFTGSGKLYVKEGTEKLDTANYTVSKDTLKLQYDYLYEGGVTITGAVGSYIITTLNYHNLTLTEDFLTPDGAIYEQIRLSK